MFDVMIITYNEALNLPRCLAAVTGKAHRVFVIDSGSTDGTPEIARSFGAEFVHHAWEGYARQKNWGLDNLPFESPWILILDADEVITDELFTHIQNIVAQPPDQVKENGFFINRLSYFMGRPIRHCGYYPSWNLRLFKRGRGRYENREVHEHIVINAPLGYIREPMIHEDQRGMEHYIAKHNRYSTLEAIALWQEHRQPGRHQEPASLPPDARRRRWLKRKFIHIIPAPGLWRFLYMYVLRLGIVDGAAGMAFCRFIGMYDSMVAMKLKDLRRRIGREPYAVPEHDVLPSTRGLAVSEGTQMITVPGGSESSSPTATINKVAVPASPGLVQMQPEPSPWSLREKIQRAVWMLIGRPLFRITFHNWYGLRNLILRAFGARIGRGVAIRPSVNIEVPWMLQIDDDATVGDHAILYSLGVIRVGKRSIISQYAHLCAGTHDYTDHTFRLIRKPIDIGDDVWIGAEAFVGPGVTVGRLTVVGARSCVYRDLDPQMVYVGNPARSLRKRVLR